jgi:alkanesulfonate monooxygenase SsuD/methylene tetrahydromethanopterin reductase-like flavin-dependent oxidoreductase (luciferase family)
MWTKNSVNFNCKFYNLQGAVCNPKPVQKPHPPIMIGAWGNRMLKLTAEVADAWNIADDPSPEVFQEKFAVIARRCKEIGRNPEEIERTWSGHVILDANAQALKNKIADLREKIMMNPEMGGAYFQLPSGEMVKVDADYLIERSIHGTPSECVSQLLKLTEAGVDHFILFFWDFPNKQMMNLFSSTVMPHLRENVPLD